jgi:mannose-6-phosphate isomerase-like protein (cupin superfamily)
MANFDVKIKQPKRVEKKWGHELWIHNDNQYCGKLLVFTNSGNKFSMHYHMLKNETWYVQEGAFQFDWIDTESAERCYTQLQKGDVVYIQKGLPHQLTF